LPCNRDQEAGSMEIIKINDSDYERYEQLLLKRDELEKDAGSIMTAYIKEFGTLIRVSFEKQIACIRLKKEIRWCQAAINRGESINRDLMLDTIRAEMEDYEKRLRQMTEENKKALRSKISDEATVLEVKRIYRRIAKLIHPDINPKTEDTSELMELWNRTVSAYHVNNLKEIQELEVLVTKALDDMGEGKIRIIIPDIRMKIAKLQKEIEYIRSTPPFTYKDILISSEKTEDKKEELQNEIREYEEYAETLKNILDHILSHGNAKIVWTIDGHDEK
jgi:hypothetical protein